MRLLPSSSAFLPDRAFLTVLGARIVSELGTWLAYVALIVAAYDRSHSGRWVSLLLLAQMVPVIFAGFLLTPLLDRLNRKYVIVAAELTGGAAFAALSLTRSVWPLLMVAAIDGAASSVFTPGLNAALPNLVSDDRLPQANALVRTVESGAMLGGPALAGVLVAGFGVDAAFLMNAVSFAASAALFATISSARLQEDADGFDAAKARGLRIVVRQLRLFRPPALRALLVSWTLASSAWVSVNVCEVILAKRVFGMGTTGYGILAAGSGAGLLVGSVLSGWLCSRFRPFPIYGYALSGAGTCLLGVGLAPSFASALLLFSLGAVGNIVAWSALQLLLQRSFSDRVMGQAFGVLHSVSFSISIVALVGSGAAVDRVGARVLVGAAGGLAAAAAVVAVLVAKQASSDVSLEQTSVARLS